MGREVGLGLGFAIGAGVATQGRVNGALGARLHDGIGAAVVSFGSGLILLMVAYLVSGQARSGVGRVRAAVAGGVLRPWQLLGGLCGAFFVTSQGLSVAALGVTVFAVSVVAGQLVSSLVVDRLGVGPRGRTAITGWRIGGAAVALAAVALTALGRNGSGPAGGSWALVMLPALAGVTLAWQQAVNGRVAAAGAAAPVRGGTSTQTAGRASTGDTLAAAAAGTYAATTINFATGFLALIAVEAIHVAFSGMPEQIPSQPWLYSGGLIGITFIATAAVAVRLIGVLLLGLTSVAGQLAMALLLDVVTPSSGVGLSVTAVAGCALTLVAVALAAHSHTDSSAPE
ncbi:DMT family transporter [Nocardia stercoris]|uniref:DMT family transporter n=1 Tax=Nocardia stercoris TaxID=2483361 RepID=A0A3M2LHF9_9NOCA|nr:DMT family transporter [Nocardia stercoris]RMI34188.1 DMT family transporter [Nocardia stercoris]